MPKREGDRSNLLSTQSGCYDVCEQCKWDVRLKLGATTAQDSQAVKPEEYLKLIQKPGLAGAGLAL
jgi:hypothetical protein